MTALQMTPDEALALADQWCAGLTMGADSKGWGAILLVLAEEVRRLREREAGLLEQHSRDSAELRRVCAERDEARADERTAMGYLAGVRQVVGGEDFPDMVRRIRADALIHKLPAEAWGDGITSPSRRSSP